MYTDGYGAGIGPSYSPPESYDFLSDAGVRLVRISVAWGNTGWPDAGEANYSDGGFANPHTGIQPVLGGPLDPVYLARLQHEVATAEAAGLVVNLSLYTSLRFPNSHSQYVVTPAELADAWIKLGSQFANDPGVHAYLIANEPYNMDAGFVDGMMQGAVYALRDAGIDKPVWVSTDAYDSCLVTANHPPYIDDPAGAVTYECHSYPGTSGGQTVYNDGGVQLFLRSVRAFHDWCVGNGVHCAIGEMGWPGQNSSADWQSFNDVGEIAYALADDAGMDVTYFGAGGSYRNNLFAYTASDAGTVLSVPGAVHPIDEAQTQSLVISAHPSH